MTDETYCDATFFDTWVSDIQVDQQDHENVPTHPSFNLILPEERLPHEYGFDPNVNETTEELKKWVLAIKWAEKSFDNDDNSNFTDVSSVKMKKSKIKIKKNKNGEKASKSSKYLGVCFESGKWFSQIKVNGKTLAFYGNMNELDTAIARDEKAFELLGKNALLNFPREDFELKKKTAGDKTAWYYSKGKEQVYNGVHYCKYNQTWRARISHDGKRRFIGNCKTQLEAVLMRNDFIKEHNLTGIISLAVLQDGQQNANTKSISVSETASNENQVVENMSQKKRKVNFQNPRTVMKEISINLQNPSGEGILWAAF